MQTRDRSDGTVAHRVMYRLADGTQTSRTLDSAAAAATYQNLLARLGAEEAQRVVEAQTSNTAAVPLLSEWLEHHLAHATGITDGTIADYRRLAVRTWLPALGHYPVDAIDRDAIARWMRTQAATTTRRGTPTSAKTIANAHGLLSTVLASAVVAHHRPDNPSKGLRLPRGHRLEMTFLSQDEFATLLRCVDPYWQPLIAFLAGTGLRWGEATALRWANVDLDSLQPTVRVAEAWKRGAGKKAGGQTRDLGVPKTARSLRTVGLPVQIADQLRARRGRPADLVFTGRLGGTVHHQNFHPRVWKVAVDRASLGKRPRIHDLRHSHASWLIAAGVPLPIIQRSLGHESIQTTVDVYGHLATDAHGIAAHAATAALAMALPEELPETSDAVVLASAAVVDGRAVALAPGLVRD